MNYPIAFLVLSLAPLAHAQMAASRDEAVAVWKMSKEFTLAVADAMPQDQYVFRPNADEMTFAALMIHIATSQAFRFAQIAGEPMPLKVQQPIPKDQVKQIAEDLLRRSFDYCI